MNIRNFTKEELGNKVLFPRTQLTGLSCQDKDAMPAKQDFTLDV